MIVSPPSRVVHFGYPAVCGRVGTKVVCADTHEETTCQLCCSILGLPGGMPRILESDALKRDPTTDKECVGRAFARWRVEVARLDQSHVGAKLDDRSRAAGRVAIANRESGFVDLSVRELLHLCSEDEALDIVREAFRLFRALPTLPELPKENAT